jgi:secondary thiamine-phosphate synthase enzyme
VVGADDGIPADPNGHPVRGDPLPVARRARQGQEIYRTQPQPGSDIAGPITPARDGASGRGGRLHYGFAVWLQREVRLDPRPRGFHLVTGEIVAALPELRELRVGLANVFLRHTSASLTLNENASPGVRRDFAAWFDEVVPEGAPYWTHTLEGPDDMPAHVKSSLTGTSLTIPVREGQLGLGTWQGIYLCEHRDRGGARRILVTVFGE